LQAEKGEVFDVEVSVAVAVTPRPLAMAGTDRLQLPEAGAATPRNVFPSGSEQLGSANTSTRSVPPLDVPEIVVWPPL
jgi:hypothetical protein